MLTRRDVGMPPSSGLLRCCLLCGLLTAATAWGQPQEVTTAQAAPAGRSLPVDWQFRFDLFQLLLEQKGLTTLSSVREALDHPEQTVVVVMGQTGRGWTWATADRFLDRGGVLLAAGDTPAASTPMWSIGGGAMPVQARNRVDRYRGYPDCISISDLRRGVSLFEGVNRLVVNRAGWLNRLDQRAGRWQILARLPAATEPRLSSRRPVLAVAQRSRTAFVMVASDPSLFTNGMLWHGDNAIFCINTAATLVDASRRYLLFLVEGDVRAASRESLPPGIPPDQLPPVPPPTELPEEVPELELQQMLRVANSVIANVEDTDLLNELVAERPRRIRDPYYHRGLLFLAAMIMMGVVTAGLLSRLRRRSQVPAVQPGVSLLEIRARTQDLAAERGVAAQTLSGGLCYELTGTLDPQVWQQRLGAYQTDALAQMRRDAQLVLAMATARGRLHLSRKRLLEVGAAVDRLREGCSPSS